MTQENPVITVVVSTKSMGVAIILTILFGPLGMLYSTIGGGIVMCLIGVPVAFFTAGIGLVVVWPVSILWAALATSSYNKNIIAGKRQY